MSLVPSYGKIQRLFEGIFEEKTNSGIDTVLLYSSVSIKTRKNEEGWEV